MGAPSQRAAAHPVERGALSRPYRRLVQTAALLALTVVVLGATVRLKDAGLGCPDWPGCYGHLTVSAALASPAEAREARWPDNPLHPERAHIEMVHRYGAGTLGLLILAIALFAWRSRRGHLTASALVGLVVFQALLGMWTVTLGLKPWVVTAHLLGGLAVLGTLWWLVLDTAPRSAAPPPETPTSAPSSLASRTSVLRPFALVALGLLAVQIALGGWTAANYAALACQGFPTCNGAWWPPADFGAGFAPGLANASADTAFAGTPTGPGLIAIHWAHRLGALAVLGVLGVLALVCARGPSAVRGAGLAVGGLLLLQVGLGIANVLAGLPLALAVAHNAGAALLLLAVLTLIHRLARGGSTTGEIDVPGNTSHTGTTGRELRLDTAARRSAADPRPG